MAEFLVGVHVWRWMIVTVVFGVERVLQTGIRVVRCATVRRVGASLKRPVGGARIARLPRARRFAAAECTTKRVHTTTALVTLDALVLKSTTWAHF